jgi:hypothetical protein
MNDPKDRLTAIITAEYDKCHPTKCPVPAELAEAIVAELHLTREDLDVPVVVEEVPRRMIGNQLGHPIPAWHFEFISHSHYVTPWVATDCPDCNQEFGVHDRRHAEIIAETKDQ